MSRLIVKQQVENVRTHTSRIPVDNQYERDREPPDLEPCKTDCRVSIRWGFKLLVWMDTKDPHDLLTAEEVIAEFKSATKTLKWTVKSLNELKRIGGLVGEWDNTLKQYLFFRWSVAAYIEYAKSLHRRVIDNLGNTG